MKCPKCGEEMNVDTSAVLTSNPPKYKAVCPKCGNIEYPYCSECYPYCTEEYTKMQEEVYKYAMDRLDKINNQDTTATTAEQLNQSSTKYETSAIEPEIPMGRYGWVCPKCGRVLSPSMTFCPFCSTNTQTTVTTGTGTTDTEWMKLQPKTYTTVGDVFDENYIKATNIGLNGTNTKQEGKA